MPRLSQSSLDKLASCHPDLQRVLCEAIKIVDFTVCDGHRGKDAQNKAVAEGKSKTPWPTSKHNHKPSLAVDVAPYPIDWKDRERFIYLAGIFKGIAFKEGVLLRWGGDWDGDSDFLEHEFRDLPHFELIA